MQAQGGDSKAEQAVLGLTALGNVNRSGDVDGLPTWRTWPPWW
jgi:hypothetical protein